MYVICVAAICKVVNESNVINSDVSHLSSTVCCAMHMLHRTNIHTTLHQRCVHHLMYVCAMLSRWLFWHHTCAYMMMMSKTRQLCVN